MNSTANANTTTCPSCETDAKMAAGEETTASERNRWAMWGCTCSTEAEAEAVAWMDSVTR